MARIADFKKEYQPPGWERLKASIRTRISVWIGQRNFSDGCFSHIPPKRRRTYVHGSDHEPNHHSGEINLAGKPKQLN